MMTLEARNVNEALPLALALVRDHGVREETRNGPVLRVPDPVAITYLRPQERVLFAPWRDANPFFHLVESMWMLAGRDDLAPLITYVNRMADYSDDGGVTQPAAYGHRWRLWPRNEWLASTGTELDQLEWVVRRLRANPGDRRVVIQMWDPDRDPDAADSDGADVPCNVSALPYVSRGCLNLTVFCRSNDLIWGACGANVVQFSFLLEYLASRVGLPVGRYTQISNNLHAYEATMPGAEALVPSENPNPYMFQDRPDTSVELFPLDVGPGHDDDLVNSINALLDDDGPVRHPFLREVVLPMTLAHKAWSKGRGEARYFAAAEHLSRVAAPDWRRAGREWIARRQDRWLATKHRDIPDVMLAGPQKDAS